MAKKDFAAQVGGVIDLYEPEDEAAEKGTHTASTPDDEKGPQTVYVRYTVILSRDELDQLKGYAWYTRRKIKDIFAEMVGEFLENHADELPKRGE